jgi:hypothetical protein
LAVISLGVKATDLLAVGGPTTTTMIFPAPATAADVPVDFGAAAVVYAPLLALACASASNYAPARRVSTPGTWFQDP